MSKSIVEITGFEELRQKISRLANDKDKRKEILSILRAVATPTVKAARQYAPQSKAPHKVRGGKIIQPGNLKKSIGKITGRKGRSRINPTIYVGPRTRGKYDGYYGAWVAEGHNIYRTGFKRNRSGNAKANARGAKSRTQPNPYMDKAYAATNGKVTKDAEKRVTRFIQRRINRLSD